jgi:hypothetical protein
MGEFLNKESEGAWFRPGDFEKERTVGEVCAGTKGKGIDRFEKAEVEPRYRYRVLATENNTAIVDADRACVEEGQLIFRIHGHDHPHAVYAAGKWVSYQIIADRMLA